jgi:arylsulfatase A-like enzyme
MRRRLSLSLAAVAALLFASCASGRADPAAESLPSPSTMPALSTALAPARPTTTLPVVRPNIVLVLTDDLDTGLLQYMPKLTELVQASGLTFTNYYVSSALCCPSRASLLRGQFPHNTTVLTNEDGFARFHRLGLESSTIATWLQTAGYRTALMGKYLNGYLNQRGAGLFEYVPPGWSEWDVAGDAFREVDYTMNHNGVLTQYGHAPEDVLSDVLRMRADTFITQSTASAQPFFLELSTFAPHFPYTVLDRYANTFPDITAPRPPSFNARGQGEPKWLAAQPSLTVAAVTALDAAYRRRVQSVQGIDEMIGHLFDTLRATGALDNTYFVFTSDNGYHLGQHRLEPGKQTPYDSDIRVPLIVRGPGVVHGSVAAMTMNVDLAPTFAALAGVRAADFVDGQSLVPLLRGTPPQLWRDVVLVEHEGPTALPGDPDYQPDDNPTSYVALRSATRLFVQYHSGELELYDYSADPFELVNLAPSAGAAALAPYQQAIDALRRCRAETCRVPATE